MGRLDILNGIQNGPRGQVSSGSQSSGGISPIMTALLCLLAYKAVKGGGLGNLINDLQKAGLGGAAQSCVGHGTNEPVAPGDLGRALGADAIDALSGRTGLGREELLAELSQRLPNMVDQLTPDGRLPTDEEASRW